MIQNYERIAGFRSDRFLITSVCLNIPPADRVGRPVPYLTRFKNMAQRAKIGLADRSLPPAIRESIEADFARVERFLSAPENTFGENSLPVRGIAFFSCSGANFFEVVKLPFAYRNVLVVDRDPYGRMLLAVEADFGTNLVVAFDHSHARCFQIDISGVHELEDLFTPSLHEREKPGVAQVGLPGGQSARHGVGGHNLEMLKQEATREHLRRIAQSIFDLHKTHPFDRLLIAAPDDLAAQFPGYLHDYMRRVFGGSIKANLKSVPSVFYEATLDRLMELDREQEQSQMQALSESLPTMAVIGVEKTLEMLSWGNVRALLVDPDFSLPGYVFYPSRLLGLRSEEAPEGTELTWQVPDLVDTIIERAIEQGATIEIMHAPEARAQIQGVSALLRYPVPLP